MRGKSQISNVKSQINTNKRQISICSWKLRHHEVDSARVAKFSQRELGFTLIELILVTAIFGLFASGVIAVINPRSQIEKGNDARRKSDIAQIQRSLESYYQDNGRYPPSSPVDYKINPGGKIEWGSAWQPYMNIVPQDPSATSHYAYYASTNGQTYILYASLERGDKDPDACTGVNGCPNMATYGITQHACGGSCNYGVSSSNVNP